jgi:hypothetical protein
MVLERGRQSFDLHAWEDAYRQLQDADQRTPLDLDDVERLAAASYLSGRGPESVELWTRAHEAYLARGDAEQAAHCAVFVAYELWASGEYAQFGGWVGRAKKVLDIAGLNCAERGYICIAEAMQLMDSGDGATAHARFTQAAGYAERFQEPSLGAFAGIGRGHALLRLDRSGEGLSMIDEAMVSVTAGEVTPTMAGTIYCASNIACHEIQELRRRRSGPPR